MITILPEDEQHCTWSGLRIYLNHLNILNNFTPLATLKSLFNQSGVLCWGNNNSFSKVSSTTE